MNKTCEEFKKYLDKNEVKYTVRNEKSISTTFSGENAPSISVSFIFDDDGLSVALRAFSVCKIPEDKLMQFYVLVNELNSKYRWVKFNIDSDNEICVEDDAVLASGSSSEECFELLHRTLRIIDQAYPSFMKILWG